MLTKETIKRLSELDLEQQQSQFYPKSLSDQIPVKKVQEESKKIVKIQRKRKREELEAMAEGSQ